MASTKRNKVQSEIEKARERLMEQQARLKELENKRTEIENMEIVDIVRGMSIPLDDLAAVLQSIKTAAIPAPLTSGQVDPKSNSPKIIRNGIDESDTEKEDESE